MIMNILNVIVGNIGLVYRIYDFSNFNITLVELFTFLTCLGGQSLYVVCYQAIQSIEDQQKRDIYEKQKETNIVKMIYKEFHQMIMSLEEGIVVIQNGNISFSNDMFLDIIKRLKLNENQKIMNTINLKVFRVYDQECDQSKEMFSISDILNNSISFLRDQIFQIDLEHN